MIQGKYGIRLPVAKIPPTVPKNSQTRKTHQKLTIMCFSIGTPINNTFSSCPKWKINHFQMSQNLG